ncbi:phosphatase [Aureococcus anophagefferens]|nr:phosphatase [Aureococcus anophagefferens]
MGGAPSRILEKLWLGGADVLDDFEAFAREKGIDAVVSLGEETVRAGIPKLHLDEQDTPETDLRRHFNAIVNFIHDHRCRGLGLLDFADDPATGSLRDQLRRTRGPLLAEDLTDVARELEASRDRVETTRKSEWLYEFSGKPVPEDAEIERDDYGLFVREDGSRCSVARAGAFLAEAEHDWSRSDAAPLDVLDYEGQISRLQAKLAPALRSKRPTPKSGLGWLARPEEKEAWAEPGDAGGDAPRRRRQGLGVGRGRGLRPVPDADAELAAALRTAPAAITAAFADDVVDLTSEPDAPAPAPAPARTLIHMMRGSEMPATASEIAEALVYMGPHAIAVRPGAGALIDGLLATGVVDVSVTTLNLEGAEAVRAVGRSTAPYARSWAGLDVTVVSGEERARRAARAMRSD